MEDFHLRLSQVKNLDAKDAAVARLITRNGWVDPEAVLEAARAAAAPDGPGLLAKLTEMGKMESARATQIQEASSANSRRSVAPRSRAPCPPRRPPSSRRPAASK